MKEGLRSFVSFTKAERLGIWALAVLILVLIVVRVTMVYWVHPPIMLSDDPKLAAANEVYQRSQEKDDETNNAGPAATMAEPTVAHDEDKAGTAESYTDKSDKNKKPLPEFININKADSGTLVRLKGIGPSTAHKIIVARAVHPLKSMDDLNAIRKLPAATNELLERHIIFTDKGAK